MQQTPAAVKPECIIEICQIHVHVHSRSESDLAADCFKTQEALKTGFRCNHLLAAGGQSAAFDFMKTPSDDDPVRKQKPLQGVGASGQGH